MNRLHEGWDGRTAEQWLDEAGRFDRMAERFGHHPALNASFASLARNARTRAADTSGSVASTEEHDRGRLQRTQMKPLSASDLDYFRNRAASEQAAATTARDTRVRQVHLEMAERYRGLICAAEASRQSRFVSGGAADR